MADGVKPDPDKVKAIHDMLDLQTLKVCNGSMDL